MTDSTSILRAIVYGTTVVAVDGMQLGTVREVLGSDADDISRLARRAGWRCEARRDGRGRAEQTIAR